jgi:hypothetical protein
MYDVGAAGSSSFVVVVLLLLHLLLGRGPGAGEPRARLLPAVP